MTILLWIKSISSHAHWRQSLPQSYLLVEAIRVVIGGSMLFKGTRYSNTPEIFRRSISGNMIISEPGTTRIALNQTSI